MVDDHGLIRQALRGVLKELRPDALVLEASNGAKAMGFVVEHPDLGLVLLDLSLPDRDGFSVLAEIVESGLKTCYKEVRLVEQSYVREPDKTVAQAVKDAEAKARRLPSTAIEAAVCA